MHLYNSNSWSQFLYIFKHNYAEFCVYCPSIVLVLRLILTNIQLELRSSLVRLLHILQIVFNKV